MSKEVTDKQIRGVAKLVLGWEWKESNGIGWFELPDGSRYNNWSPRVNLDHAWLLLEKKTDIGLFIFGPLQTKSQSEACHAILTAAMELCVNEKRIEQEEE